MRSIPVRRRSNSTDQMRQRAAQVGGVENFSRLGLCPRDQLGQRIDAERRGDREHHRLLADEADADEIPLQVERQVRQHFRHHDESGGGGHVKRGAVGRRGGRDAGGGAAGGARVTENQHLLSPQPPEMIGHNPGDDVRAAPGGTLRDELHRIGRIILGLRGATSQGSRRQQPQPSGPWSPPVHWHRFLPTDPLSPETLPDLHGVDTLPPFWPGSRRFILR